MQRPCCPVVEPPADEREQGAGQGGGESKAPEGGPGAVEDAPTHSPKEHSTPTEEELRSVSPLFPTTRSACRAVETLFLMHALNVLNLTKPWPCVLFLLFVPTTRASREGYMGRDSTRAIVANSCLVAALARVLGDKALVNAPEFTSVYAAIFRVSCEVERSRATARREKQT